MGSHRCYWELGSRSFIFSILILHGCTKQKSDGVITTANAWNFDSLQFPLKEPSVISKRSDSVATLELDSLFRHKWTDRIVPAGLVKTKLYSARLFAKYNSVGAFNLIAVINAKFGTTLKPVP